MSTGVVSIDSDLVRNRWTLEGMVQAASKSFWAPLTGTSEDSIVYQVNNNRAGAGHTVVFQYRGNTAGKAKRGKETAFGTGEQKKLFSDKATVERFRFTVDNGEEFDARTVGDLSLSLHSDARKLLSDQWVRFKDQSLFDAAQGLLYTNDTGLQAPSHVIDLQTTFTWNQVLDISNTLKTSQGFDTGDIRAPLKGFMTEDTANGPREVWLFVIDSTMATMLKKDVAGYQTLIRTGDVRGNKNRNIYGVIGRIGDLMVVEASQFFGATPGTTSGWRLNDFSVESCGLRQYDGADPTTALWTGQEGFDYASSTLHSRGVILGRNALQLPVGKHPEYRWQSSEDFGIKSESALVVYLEARKTILKPEDDDYVAAKVADLDYGVVTVDLQVGS